MHDVKCMYVNVYARVHMENDADLSHAMTAIKYVLLSMCETAFVLLK